MCFANIELRVMADPRVQALHEQWEVSEDLRRKFMAASPDKPDELLNRYDAFMAAWRKFHQLRRELG